MNEELTIPPFLRQIIVIAVIFVAIMGLKFSAEIMGPILLAIFISIIIYPVLMWLKKRGLSYNQGVAVTLVGILALVAAILGFLVVSLGQLVKEIPNLTINSSSILAQYGNQIIQFIVTNIPIENITGLITIGTFLIFAIMFLVYELPLIKERLINGLGADNPNLNKIFYIIEANINYFIIRAKVNLNMELVFRPSFLSSTLISQFSGDY